ncbi:MAG: hypothetical protein Kow00114_25340 [Kiloniellaceae bacterium]
MKYFTRAWADGTLPDGEWEATGHTYRRRIEQIAGLLPEPLLTLARDISLHDALIRQVCADLTSARLSLRLVCGDLQVGYFDLNLEYRGVDWRYVNRKVLARRAEEEATEILYDEVDCLPEGGYEHRILFWPEDEIVLRFRALTLQRTERTDRDFTQAAEPYVEVSA